MPEELQGAVFRTVRLDELSDLLDQVISTLTPRARRLDCKGNENVRIGKVGVLAGLERLYFGGNETGPLAGVRTVGHAEGVGNSHIETQGFPKSPGSQGLAVGTASLFGDVFAIPGYDFPPSIHQTEDPLLPEGPVFLIGKLKRAIFECFAIGRVLERAEQIIVR